MSFFCLGSHPGPQAASSSHLLRPLQSETGPQSFLSFLTLIRLKSISQFFCRMPLNLDLTHVFLTVRLRLCIVGKNTTEVIGPS